MTQSTVVTRANFASLLPSVLHNLREADFVAVDTELTGLCARDENVYSRYDEPETRYAKLKASAETFGVLQYGLSAFKWSASARRFDATTWAFHVFPAESGSSSENLACWALQLSTVHFLTEHGFDFNKSLKEGVPYVSLDAEDARRRRHAADAAGSSDRGRPLNRGDALFLEEAFALVVSHCAAHGLSDFTEFDSVSTNDANETDCSKEAINDGANGATFDGANGMTNGVTDGVKDDGPKEVPPLVIGPMSAFRRALLYDRMPRRFPGVRLDKVDESADDARNASIRVTFPSPDDRAAAAAAFEAALAEAAGFRRVFDQLARCEKAVVGHNCWLDLMHAAHGLVGPLPATLGAFSRDVLGRRMLPGRACVFDTKNVARAVFRELDGHVPVNAVSLDSPVDPIPMADAESLFSVPADTIPTVSIPTDNNNTVIKTTDTDNTDTPLTDRILAKGEIQCVVGVEVEDASRARRGRRDVWDRMLYETAAYSGAAASELTDAAARTSLEKLATLADSPAVWGVRVPVAGGKTPAARSRRAPASKEPAASFHDAGFDAFATGKVFVALAALVARHVLGDAGTAPEAVRDVVLALVAGAPDVRGAPLPAGVAACRDQVYMMVSDYEDGVVVRGDARQRRPDRTNVLVAVCEDPAADMRPGHVHAAVRAALGSRSYVPRARDGPPVAWPHVWAAGRAPPDATVCMAPPGAHVILPFAVPVLVGCAADGSVVVPGEARDGGPPVAVRLWPYAAWALRRDADDGRESPKRPRPF